MNIDRSLEDRIARTLADEAPGRAPDHLSDSILAVTAERRPRPRWLTFIAEAPMTHGARPEFGSPLARSGGVLVVAMLLVALTAGTLIVGASLLPRPSLLIPPERGVFTTTGSMLAPSRRDATATLLADGRVLVIGGDAPADSAMALAEIWDPTTGDVSPAGSLVDARWGHSATLLPDGDVLVVGGHGNHATTAELWSHDTLTFADVGSAAADIVGNLALLQPDGRVLVVPVDTEPGASMAEIWDPITRTFTAASAPMSLGSFSDGIALPDGRVLIVRGCDPCLGADASAELWDPATDSATPTGPLAHARSDHSLTLLRDGRVLVVGGSDTDCVRLSPPGGKCGRPLATAEVWDPATGLFSATGSLNLARSRHAAVMLEDGRVLIVGGDESTAEVFELR